MVDAATGEVLDDARSDADGASEPDGAPEGPYHLPDLNILKKGAPHAAHTPENDRVIRALTGTFQQFIEDDPYMKILFQGLLQDLANS